MVETNPRLFAEFMLLTFLLWQFSFTHGTSELDPKEVTALSIIVDRLQSMNMRFNFSSCDNPNGPNYSLRIQCTENCGPDKINRYCHVKEFSFNDAGLTGIIPEEIKELKHLEKLDLSNNALTGFIPATLWNLSSLTELDLSSNQLVGKISERIGFLHNLTILDLSNNALTGLIPATSWNSSSLTKLDLSENQLVGNIPENIGFLHNLKILYLDHNFLSGRIPISLGALNSLKILTLYYNQLSGQIPDQLGNITTVETLVLDMNRLCGPLPPSLGKLSNLQNFWADSNNLTGEFPGYTNLKGLIYFSISGNNMFGRFPADFIKSNTQLNYLSMLGNNFEGSLPAEVFYFSSLRYLMISDLANSSFELPPSANLSSIYVLILRNCSITGKIPDSIGSMSNLNYLDLSFNHLTGGIPGSMSSLGLTHLSLARNQLNGTIPSWVGEATTRLDLSYNNFSNVSFGGLDNKRDHLNLFACCQNSTNPHHQLFTDPWNTTNSHCPGGKSKYNSLFINCGGEGVTVGGKYYEADTSKLFYHISPNKTWAYSLSGDFLTHNSNPSEFTLNQTCGLEVTEAKLYVNARIAPVSLTYYAFCLHNGRYNVTLDFAEILFRNDSDYGRLKRRVFDVSIQGKKKLTNFDITDEGRSSEVVTKSFIVPVKDTPLEIFFYWAGKGSTDDPPTFNGPLISAISVTQVDHRPAIPPKLKMALIIAVPSSVVLLLLLLVFMWKMGWLGKRELREIQIGHGEHVTLEKLIGATRNFSSKMEIGKGHFGKVYKAELERGRTVAVKRLSSEAKEQIEELLNEFYALKSLRHENLVQLLDGYFRKGLHLLIYEYMPNKSIADALFGSNSRLKLNWETRFNICLGIARGLEHLHEQPRLKMVHRDIKTENILLDEALNAKISDFGLASLYTEEEQLKIIKVEATNGYMAPEYAIHGFVTSKADVYSFGVVILEIVSGIKNAGYKFNHESEYLLDKAYVAHKQERLMDMVDKSLSSSYDAKQAITLLKLGVLCTSISPTLRPRMADVVSILVGEKTFQQIINPPASDDHHRNASIASEERNKADSSTSTEVTSRASTSTKLMEGIGETEHEPAETDREILEESQTSH